MPGYLEGIIGFDVGMAVLTEYDADGFLTTQIDAYGEEKSGVLPYDAHHFYGRISRPHDPETGPDGTPRLGCVVLIGMDGGRGHVWHLGDPRVTGLLPRVKKGGNLNYGGKLKNPGFYYMDGDTGSQTIYVPYKIVNDVPQKAMTIEINVDNEGQESISIIHGSGAAVSITEAGGDVSVMMKNAKGNAYVEVNDEGGVLNGQWTVQGGFNAGGPESAVPLVRAPELITLLQQLCAVIASINISFTQGAAIAPILARLATIVAKNTKGA